MLPFCRRSPRKTIGPPTLSLPFRRRSPAKSQDLRHFCRLSVGVPQNNRTSDTFAAFPLEVPRKKAGPPTLLPPFCRRSPAKQQDLRHFRRLSAGGPLQNGRTSDTLAAFPSEVPRKNKVPPTLSGGKCRRYYVAGALEPVFSRLSELTTFHSGCSPVSICLLAGLFRRGDRLEYSREAVQCQGDQGILQEVLQGPY